MYFRFCDWRDVATSWPGISDARRRILKLTQQGAALDLRNGRKSSRCPLGAGLRWPKEPYTCIRWGCALTPHDEYVGSICAAAAMRPVATISVERVKLCYKLSGLQDYEISSNFLTLGWWSHLTLPIHRHIAYLIIILLPTGERNIVMTVSLSVYVCVCFSVCKQIAGSTRLIFAKILCMLPMAAVARSSYGSSNVY